jgi:hypothetical protein
MGELVEAAVEEEETDVNEDDYRTISFTLKKVLKPTVEYGTFKEILNNH